MRRNDMIDDNVSQILNNSNEALIIRLENGNRKQSVSVHTKLAMNSRLSSMLENILENILEKQNAKQTEIGNQTN